VCAATPAAAEVGATASIFSDARFRGASVSNDHPVGLLDLSYDDADGLYLGVSGTAVGSSHSVRPLSLRLNAGYARRLSSGVTLDAGVVHSLYSHYSSAASARSYTEAYLGAAWRGAAARVYFSPHYFEIKSPTLYAELEDNLQITRKVRLNGHIGLLAPLRSHNGSGTPPVYDWRIGLTHQFGRASAQVSWTGRSRVRRYEDGYLRATDAIVVGVSYAL
jgi:uncharacterized protein (TIGR02001 family)